MNLEIFGFIFAVIIGTIGHFLYELSNKNNIVGFLFARNESIFEHIKLGVTPIILWAIIELLTNNFNSLFFIKFISILSFIFSLIIFYYSYKTFTKRNILFIDIFIFYLSLFISSVVSIKMINNYYNILLNIIGFIGISFILYLYKKKYQNNVCLIKNI